MRTRSAALFGLAAALVVAAIAIAKRPRGDATAPSVESTHAVRIVRRDRVGLPVKQGMVREPARVRAIIEALGVDIHPSGACPADYADADFGIVLSGSNVYVRRNVYVFGLLGDGGAASVVSVTSAGCRVGAPADDASLRRELSAAGTLE